MELQTSPFLCIDDEMTDEEKCLNEEEEIHLIERLDVIYCHDKQLLQEHRNTVKKLAQFYLQLIKQKHRGKVNRLMSHFERHFANNKEMFYKDNPAWTEEHNFIVWKKFREKLMTHTENLINKRQN